MMGQQKSNELLTNQITKNDKYMICSGQITAISDWSSGHTHCSISRRYFIGHMFHLVLLEHTSAYM